MRFRFFLAALPAVMALACALGVAAQAPPASRTSDQNYVMPSVTTVPDAARPSDHFDPAAATEAYLAQIPPAARARSDAYFEGGYWLILWDFLFAVAMFWVLLRFRISAAMRDLSERITRIRPLQTFLYAAQFFVLTALIGFPLAAYEGFFREKKYGMATQTFGGWTVDQLKALLVNLIIGGLLITALVAIVRALPRSWHVWGAIVTMLFLIFGVMIAPVVIVPMFYKITKLEDPRIVKPILSLAHANGISANDVYMMNASRDTTKMSANVSGFGKTMRITLNDNLVNRGSPEEIQSVMGHEMGHYVLNHIPKSLLFFLVVTVLFFSLLRWGLDAAIRRYGPDFGIRDIGDTAALPLALLIVTVFGFVMTPIDNTYTRVQEFEADMYGLNASRQPDGFAQAAIHLGEYRKMSPGPVEEWFFYDHPSGRRRIFAAMQWKSQNLGLFAAQAAPATAASAAAAQPASAK
ncbi:MAG TPA: M48 family metallopeptidase [Dongiaceae bacterium]|nr:M48 family metallopeptidase [Dongiaceae bacterium]